MIFDVVVRVGKNAAGKDIFNVCRVHDAALSQYLRNVQDVGHYIISVIPLFRKKENIRIEKDDEEGETEHFIFRKDIDPCLIRTNRY